MVAAKQNIADFCSTMLASSEKRCWYAIYTKAAKEDVAVEYISRMRIETFNPKIKKNRKIWGAMKEINAPLFPCYIFARFSDSMLHAIKYARGVRCVVGNGHAPTPIDEQVISFIRTRAENEYDACSTPQVQPGDLLVINRGPLYGVEGVFLEASSGQDRVSILLKSIEWQARVLVERNAIEKLVR